MREEASGAAADLLPRLSAFAQLLHDAGLEAGPRRLTDATRALTHIELRREADFRNALRTVFVGRKEDLPTFDAAFGSAAGTFVGGGAQIVLRGGAYIEVSASRFQKSGQRAFFADGESFRLGIPLTASLTPIEASVGYRFNPEALG